MGIKIDLTGQKFGRLTAISDCGKVKSGQGVKWICKCDCGNEVTVVAANLKNGNTNSCGCYKRQRIKESNNGGKNKLKLDGKKFGRLTVIDSAGSATDRKIWWNCLCECGKKVIVPGVNLKNGTSTSCGCYRTERLKESNVTHGQSYKTNVSGEYKAWATMRERCYNTKLKYYKDWGGRGIIVCERWRNSFEDFFEDMGKRPSSRHSLDRFPDKNGNYEKSNCRWATYGEQSRNRRSNIWVEYNGKKMVLTDWIKFLRSISTKE